jgi:pimeloyl-ACP methyl ester carboxylesterase
MRRGVKVNNNVAPADHGHFFAVNGIELFFVDYSEGDPLVLLHGGTGSAIGNWNPFCGRLR